MIETQQLTPKAAEFINRTNKQEIAIQTILKFAEISWSAWASRKEFNHEIENATASQKEDLSIKFEGMSKEQRAQMYVMSAYKLNSWAEFMTNEGFTALLALAEKHLPTLRQIQEAPDATSAYEMKIKIADNVSQDLQSLGYKADATEVTKVFNVSDGYGAHLEKMVEIHNSAWAKSRVDILEPEISKHYWMRPYSSLSTDPSTSKEKPSDIQFSYSANLVQVLMDFALLKTQLPNDLLIDLQKKFAASQDRINLDFFRDGLATDFSTKYEPSNEELALHTLN